jgi:excinuclease ABC subunit A
VSCTPGHAGRHAGAARGHATGATTCRASVEFPSPVDLRDRRVRLGKSTLVNDTLYAAVAAPLHRAHEEPQRTSYRGHRAFRSRSSTSTSRRFAARRAATRPPTGLFTPIRELMAEMNTARERGYEVPGASAST